MKSIVVASTNPVKIAAALAGFRAMFPAEIFEARGVSVPSGVSDQPMSDGETLTGAANRAGKAQDVAADADYWAGIEGGIEEQHGQMWALAWVVIRDRTGKVGRARTAAFALPGEIAALVRQGIELGEADDRVFGRSNSKQGNGAVGILTGDVIDRAGYYEHAVVLALIAFTNLSLSFWAE